MSCVYSARRTLASVAFVRRAWASRWVGVGVSCHSARRTLAFGFTYTTWYRDGFLGEYCCAVLRVYVDIAVFALYVARQGTQDAGRICHTSALAGSAARHLCHRGIGGHAFSSKPTGRSFTQSTPMLYICFPFFLDGLAGVINGQRPTTAPFYSTLSMNLVSVYFLENKTEQVWCLRFDRFPGWGASSPPKACCPALPPVFAVLPSGCSVVSGQVL